MAREKKTPEQEITRLKKANKELRDAKGELLMTLNRIQSEQIKMKKEIDFLSETRRNYYQMWVHVCEERDDLKQQIRQQGYCKPTTSQTTLH